MSWEEKTGTKISAKIKWLICFSVQQCQHEVTSLLCNPQSCCIWCPCSSPIHCDLSFLSSFPSSHFSLFFSPDCAFTHFHTICSHFLLPANHVIQLLIPALRFPSFHKIKCLWCNTETHRILISAKCVHLCESCGEHSATLMSTFH